MAFNYTPDQQKQSKDRPEGNILVSASAGSGKPVSWLIELSIWLKSARRYRPTVGCNLHQRRR